MSGPMSGVGAEMQFWAAEVLPGKPFKVDLSPEFAEDDEARTLELLHITNMAFGPNPKAGQRYTVSIESGDKKAMVGTLIPEKVEQCCMDLIFSEDLVIRQSGPTPVHISGYKSISYALPSDLDDDSDDEMLGDPSQADDSSEEEEEPPKLVSARKVEKVVDDEAEESDDSEDGEEDDDEDGMEDSDDEDDEDDEEDLEDATKKKLQKLFGVTPKGKSAQEGSGDDEDDEDDEDSGDEDDAEAAMDAAMNMEEGDDDSDEEDDDSEDDDGSEDDEDGEGAEDSSEVEEEEEPQRKRAAPQAQTPVSKKAKAEPKKDTPAKTPAKTPAGAATPSGAKEFETALLDFIKSAGKPVGLSEIGSKVKKPAGVPKLKEFLSARPKMFKLDSNMKVHLA